MSYFRLIPAWVWVGLALMAAGLWYGHLRYKAGEASTQVKWDKAIAAGQVELARLKAEAGKITVKTETVYVDRIKTIREKGDAIVREVPVFVPAGACTLPGGFRLLHDAAAGGQSLPDRAGIADAAPIDAQVVATTVAVNYGTCHETSARLTGLQDWVRAQCKINPPAEGC